MLHMCNALSYLLSSLAFFTISFPNKIILKIARKILGCKNISHNLFLFKKTFKPLRPNLFPISFVTKIFTRSKLRLAKNYCLFWAPKIANLDV